MPPHPPPYELSRATIYKLGPEGTNLFVATVLPCRPCTNSAVYARSTASATDTAAK